MSRYIYIKVFPVLGRLCRSPEGILVPEEGMVSVRSTYWNRRIKDGDVTAEPFNDCSDESLTNKQENDNDYS